METKKTLGEEGENKQDANLEQQESNESSKISLVDDGAEVFKLQKEIEDLNTKADLTVTEIHNLEKGLGITETPVEKISSIAKLREKAAKSLNKLNNIILLTTALMATSSQATAEDTTPKKDDSKNKKIEASIAQQVDTSNISQTLMKSNENNIDEEKKDIESLDGPDNSTKELNISSFFKTGTVEYVDAGSEERAMQSVRDFLDTIKDLENSTIKVLGTYSVDRKWGDISTEHPDGDKNTEIAKAREQACLALLNKVLKERYTDEQIANISIESIAKGVALADIYTTEEIEKMTQEERNHNIDLLQGMSLEIIKKIVKQAEKVGLSEAVKDYLNAAVVILDQSNSMKDDAKEVKKIVEEVNAQNKDQVKTITLEGGNNEAHLKTLKNVLAGLDSSAFGKNIILITDEFDESTDSYDKDVEEILEMAEKLGVNIIIKVSDLNIYKNRPKGGTITVNLKNNKDVLKPLETISGKKHITKEDLKEAKYLSLVNSVQNGSLASN